MRERGFRAAWRFYRRYFRAVLLLSLLFYVVIIGLAAAAVVELGYYAFFALTYLIVASIFWLQAPLARLMEDVRAGRPNPGARRTLTELGPHLGSITGGTFLAAVGVSFGLYLFIIPGLLLLARWALFIPVIVIERTKAVPAFGRSNQLVRGHTGRVVVELVVSGILFLFVWSIALAFFTGDLPLWAAVPLGGGALVIGTPVIPLMRVLSYYDLVQRAPASGPRSAARASR